ncbi:MAG: hypothetical protein GC160_19415 [Acidobacteria bacterium]|nr:hypothetical protein [Acidobacteriota bacterium]
MFDVASYSLTVGEFLHGLEEGCRRMPLAPTRPVEGKGLAALRRVTVDELFDGARVASREFAQCVRSALFLYYSALDDSHRISQDIGSPSGSFLHGIMHRQEPDYSNAKYWFRRVGSHELFPTLREDALRLPLKSEVLPAAIRSAPKWDPFWFVDQVERAVAGDDLLAADLIEIQRLEWDLLFDYSYRRALSG